MPEVNTPEEPLVVGITPHSLATRIILEGFCALMNELLEQSVSYELAFRLVRSLADVVPQWEWMVVYERGANGRWETTLHAREKTDAPLPHRADGR
jgi:hypothetical protein